jgi:hypothetical protein
MRTVAALRVNTIELAHPLTQIPPPRLHHQVVVVRHQTIRINHPTKALTNLAQNLQPSLAVVVAQVIVFSPITARGDVIKRVVKFEAEGAGHGWTLFGGLLFCKT